MVSVFHIISYIGSTLSLTARETMLVPALGLAAKPIKLDYNIG